MRTSSLIPRAVFSAALLTLPTTGITVLAQDAPPRWESSAAVGLTLAKGNSDTLLFTANALSSKKQDQHEISLGADLSYGESDGEKNNQAVRGFVQYNHLFSERLYGYARAEGLHDDVAGVEYRITLSPGIGYYFIKDSSTTLSAEAGPGVVIENQGGSRTYLTLRLAEKFEHKFSDRARLWQSLEFLPQVDDFNNFIINAELGVEAGLTERSSLRVYVQDTYDNEPAAGRRKNDVKLVSAIAWKF